MNELDGGLLYHDIMGVVFLFINSHSRMLVSTFDKTFMIIVTK